MRLNDTKNLGAFVRLNRRAAGLNQTELAERAAVSRRWLSDLETGKPTVEAGLVFQVLAALGLFLDANPEMPIGLGGRDAHGSDDGTNGKWLQAASSIVIRLAQPAEVAAMRAIEAAAGRAFAAIGMNEVAEDEPLSAAELLNYQRDGRAWVAVNSSGPSNPGLAGEQVAVACAQAVPTGKPGPCPVAYLIVDRVDGNAHIEQVSVDPAFRGRGIGAALIEQAANWGREWGALALTLTSFAEVSWNAPYYERLGFRPLNDAQLTPGLRRIRAVEAAHGLDRWPRLAMRKDLAPSGGRGVGLPR